MAKRTWLEKVSEQLADACNGDIIKSPNMTECRMNNGFVTASIIDGTRILDIGTENRGKFRRATMESQSDEMVVTRSLSGSIEFLHRRGDKPEVRIEQKWKSLRAIEIDAYNGKVKTSLHGKF